jgi:MYXO-CTERM domain-containing protein
MALGVTSSSAWAQANKALPLLVFGLGLFALLRLRQARMFQ